MDFISLLFFKKILLFIYMYILPGLGLGCRVGFSVVAVSWGYSLVAVPGSLTLVSLVAEHGLLGHMCFSSSSRAQAQQLWHMDLIHPRHADLPIPGVKPVSPALVGSFFTIDPPGTPIDFPSLNE